VFKAGFARCGSQRSCHRLNQRLGTVADGHYRGYPLGADDADGVGGDVRGHARAGWIRQVISKRDLDVTCGLDPDDDETVLGHETEQLRDGREERCWRVG
jgi:hypothetical protein